MLDLSDLSLDELPLRGLVSACVERGSSPSQLAAAAAEAVARHSAMSFLAEDSFSLFAGIALGSNANADFETLVEAITRVPEFDLGPALPGRVYELALQPDARRRQGSHFTSSTIARRLIEVAMGEWVEPSRCVVLDPCCGGGAFLLAAAEQLHADRPDVSRLEIAQGLTGRDIDPAVLDVAQVSVALWAAADSGELRPAGDFAAADAALDKLPPADLIVGNPPFLNQLATATALPEARRASVRERFGAAVGAYTNEAAIILLASLEALREGGRLVLIQPISLLAARDGAGTRATIAERHHLRGLWVCPEQVFDAAVSVCAPVVDAVPPDRDSALNTWRWAGPDVAETAARKTPLTGETWARLGADVAGIPSVDFNVGTSRAGTIGDIASATAGFRDQFYGFAPHVIEADGAPTADVLQATTVGMIDPLRNRWGTQPFAIAGRRFTSPMVPLAPVDADNPSLGAWARARSVPKVVVATQTRVIEVHVDESGTLLPITPVISVEPHSRNAGDLWLLAALLSAPAVTAFAHAEQFGSAMSLTALKVSATFIESLPVPVDRTRWETGADLARAAAQAADGSDHEQWHQLILQLGEVMADAWPGTSDRREVLDWWKTQLPPWR